MARVGKITISVETGNNTERISYSSTGRMATVALNNTSGIIDHPFRTTAATSDLYWTAIIEYVKEAIA